MPKKMVLGGFAFQGLVRSVKSNPTRGSYKTFFFGNTIIFVISPNKGKGSQKQLDMPKNNGLVCFCLPRLGSVESNPTRGSYKALFLVCCIIMCVISPNKGQGSQKQLDMPKTMVLVFFAFQGLVQLKVVRPGALTRPCYLFFLILSFLSFRQIKARGYKKQLDMPKNNGFGFVCLPRLGSVESNPTRCSYKGFFVFINVLSPNKGHESQKQFDMPKTMVLGSFAFQGLVQLNVVRPGVLTRPWAFLPNKHG